MWTLLLACHTADKTPVVDTDSPAVDTDTVVVDTPDDTPVDTPDDTPTDTTNWDPSCPQPPAPGDTDPPALGTNPLPRQITDSSGATGPVVAGVDAFGWTLLQRATPTGNLTISPLSLAAALGLTLEGAEGATASQLATALGATAPGWAEGFAALLADLSGTSQLSGAEVHIANRLFGEQTVAWHQPFLDRCANAWSAPLQTVDLVGAPDAAADTVNAWVEGQTCGMIPTLLPPGVLKTTTRLVLVNALFAQADWSTPFDPNATAPDTFHAPDRDVSVPFMVAETGVTLHREPGLTVASLPLRGGELGVWFIMPDDVANLPALTASLSDATLQGWTTEAAGRAVELHMPKYATASALDASALLADIGVVDLFSPDLADLDAMADDPNLYVSAVQHQATIQFDEIGLRAAAATAVASSDSGGRPLELRLDRPFLWVLRDELTGLVLFVGRTVDPTAG